MLNLPQNTLARIKDILTRQQTRVEQELKDIESDDVVLADSLAESSEPGTESFEADAHNRITAAKNDLLELLAKTKKSLTSLSRGTYGVCEKCKKPIEADRLKVMPTANLCISCSKKTQR